MTRIQVISRDERKGSHVFVEVQVPEFKLKSIKTALYLAGIDAVNSSSPYGWQIDSMRRTVLITQPWRYRGRVDNALKTLSEGCCGGFRTALDLRVGVI
jgi:hypothetical protein